MKYDRIKNLLLLGIFAVACAVLGFALIKYALPIIIPFGAAFVLSCGIRKLARFISGKTGKCENVWSALILAVSLVLISLFIWYGVSAIVREIRSSVMAIIDELSGGKLISGFYDFIGEIGERFGEKEKLQSALEDMLRSAAGELSSLAASFAAGAIAAMPSVLFALIIGIVSLFYFTFGYRKTADEIKKLIPKGYASGVCQSIGSAVRGLWRFIRAYSAIMLITCGELFIGFLILKVEHAFVLALLISIIDILPVLGVGTVLVPWIIVCLATGNAVRAIGLGIILAVIWALRQPLEAKIIGSVAGVHPIFALFSVYTGYKLGGVAGMILAPMLLSCAKIIWEDRKINIKTA